MSVEREVFALPADFLVLATQNPREFEGTYPLPESQLDRFMLRIDMDYPEREAETEIWSATAHADAVAATLVRALAQLERALLEAARTRADRRSMYPTRCGLRARSRARLARARAGCSSGLSTRGALALLQRGAHRCGLARRGLRRRRMTSRTIAPQGDGAPARAYARSCARGAE